MSPFGPGDPTIPLGPGIPSQPSRPSLPLSISTLGNDVVVLLFTTLRLVLVLLLKASLVN